MRPHEKRLYMIITLLLVFITAILTHMWTQDWTSREPKASGKSYQYRSKPEYTGKVNINTASFSELCSIPQIGKTRAQGIIDGRPYYSIEDILRAKGIGPKTFDKIKDYITVGETARSLETPAPSGAKPSPGSLQDIFSATCFKVLDGDTIIVDGNRKVRLVGIDTPEVRHGKKKAQPGAYAAKSFTQSHCLGKTIYLDIDDKDPVDKYNRTLALVYLDQGAALKGEHYSLNAMLLRGGHAKILYYSPSEFNPYSWVKK